MDSTQAKAIKKTGETHIEDKALELAIAAINKQFGEGAIMRMGNTDCHAAVFVKFLVPNRRERRPCVSAS